MPSVRPGVGVEITREAVGVVGVITPWNFPIAIPAWKLAPALCYGNTVVFKPADLVPGCAWELVDILQRAGLPEGVLNLVMGRGSVVGQTIVESPDVDALTFTGSQPTGAALAVESAKLMRKSQMEMGGKNPFVVLADADLDIAVDCVIQGAFYSTGQRCTASSRIIVEEAIHDRFLAALTERMQGAQCRGCAGTQARRSVRSSTKASLRRTRITSRSASPRARALWSAANALYPRDRRVLPDARALCRLHQ